MHEYFPKHSRMGTARMQYDKETNEDGKKRGVSIERSKAGTKKRSPLQAFYKILKKYNKIQLTKNKMDLNNRAYHPPR